MIKQLGLYLLSFVCLSLLGFYLQTLVFTELAIRSSLLLKNIYAFLGIFSLLLCSNLFLLSHAKKFKDQLGFLYLVSVVLKIIGFCIVFNQDIFNNNSFTNEETFNILIPITLNLILEVFFISKILNNFTALKNVK